MGKPQESAKSLDWMSCKKHSSQTHPEIFQSTSKLWINCCQKTSLTAEWTKMVSTGVYLSHYSGWYWSEKKPWSSSVAPGPSMWQPAAPQCNCCFVEVPRDPPNSEPAIAEDTCMLASEYHHNATSASFQSPVTVPVAAQPSPTVGKPCLLRTHVELRKVSWRGDSLQGLVWDPCYQSLPGHPQCVWLNWNQNSTISVSLMSSCYWQRVFWHSSTSRLLSKPRGAKVDTSSTCVNKCLVSHFCLFCPTSVVHWQNEFRRSSHGGVCVWTV